MLSDFNKILVLAPHTDDAEIGCGGTVAKLVEEGKKVFWAVFSKASIPTNFPTNIVLKELKESAKVIGVNPKNLFVYGYKIRHLPEHRQSILENMIALRKKINPDIIFMPTLNDIHQDHFTVAQEGLRAFKHISILGYEDPWNNLTFNTSSFVHLGEEHVNKKITALKKYRSQKNRLYMSANFIKSLAHSRGIQIGVQYAEAFEVLRWIIQ